MKNYILLALLVLGSISNSLIAQLSMSDPDYDQLNPLDCAGIVPGGGAGTNFTDAGGAGNYAPNSNETIVLCPDLAQGSKVSIAFATNIGFTWDVDGSDFLYIYDGPSAASPLIGAYNSVTNPIGFFVQASWNNPSGCLTLVFISDGAIEGTGWDANVACGNPQQPYIPHIEAFVNGVGPNVLNPLDTGYVDICFGDSILFMATPEFPNAFEVNGFGYSQNVGNCTYDWTISGVGQYPNAGSTFWFTPPARSGYFVDLRMTDIFPLIERITCKVRVSQLPSFAGTGPLDGTVCVGENTVLIGGVTPTDTVGIDIPGGEFEIGGVFAGLTQLPDGSGAQYTTSIDISGFDTNTVITNGSDIDELCLDIEHSYIGDLEIMITCPNGTSVSLMNAYNQAGGMIPGGCGNGISTFLGNDTNIDGGPPGSPVWTYCFSETSNTFGTICAENALGNWVTNDYGFTSMNPNGVYLPDGAFGGLAGCPVNGSWTITVQDNQGIDDGYIFQWGIFFNAALFPSQEGYQNYVVTEGWLPDPTIVSGQNDTLIVVQPNTPGTYNYTYTMTDDFGCDYDTTVALVVLPRADIMGDTIACNFGIQVAGTTAYAGGQWIAGPQINFSPNSTTLNPNITASSPGVYTVGFIDATCLDTLYSEITFPQEPTIFNDTSVCNLSYIVTGTDVFSTGGVWSEPTGSITFSTSANQSNPTLVASASGIYNLTFTDNICGNTDVATIEFMGPPSIFSDTIACNFNMDVLGTVSYQGGTWTAVDTAIHFTPNANVENPNIWTYGVSGQYEVTFTDNACNTAISALIDFYGYPSTWLEDTTLCNGVIYVVQAPNDNEYQTNYSWSDGTQGTLLTVSQPGGTYYLTMSNYCHSNFDTITVDYKLCDIETPNILSLAPGSQNSLWYVQAEGLSSFSVYITNRWGNIVYECEDALAKCYWDGRNKNGVFVEEGTYFYTIIAEDESGSSLDKQGFIQVVD